MTLLLINVALCLMVMTLIFRPQLVGFAHAPLMKTRPVLAMMFAALSFVLLLIGVTAAAAQEAGQDGANAIDWVELLMPVIAAVLTLIVGYAATWISAKSGIDVEAGDRNALHSALLTGARLALTRQLTGQAAIALILQYASKSVPDALQRLKPNQGILRDLAESKLQEAATGIGKDALDRALEAAVNGGLRRG